MNSISKSLHSIKSSIPSHVELIAVSKTKPIEDILTAHQAGHRHFGENKSQEVMEKAPNLPDDIKWHFIGHLQRKKVRQIIKYTHLIHSVDSLKLLEEIDSRARQINKVQDVLLQIHIADEEHKFGLTKAELPDLIHLAEKMGNVRIVGLMGMATFTKNTEKILLEFQHLRSIFSDLKMEFYKNSEHFKELSMGMSGDYQEAISSGSTMVRIGSSIFGHRQYQG